MSSVSSVDNFSQDNHGRFKCPDCEVTCARRADMKRHVNKHTGVFKCDPCDYNFTTSLSLVEHNRAKHAPQSCVPPGPLDKPQTATNQNFLCPHCQKHFTTQLYLEMHLKSKICQLPVINSNTGKNLAANHTFNQNTVDLKKTLPIPLTSGPAQNYKVDMPFRNVPLQSHNDTKEKAYLDMPILDMEAAKTDTKQSISDINVNSPKSTLYDRIQQFKENSVNLNTDKQEHVNAQNKKTLPIPANSANVSAEVNFNNTFSSTYPQNAVKSEIKQEPQSASVPPAAANVRNSKFQEYFNKHITQGPGPMPASATGLPISTAAPLPTSTLDSAKRKHPDSVGEAESPKKKPERTQFGEKGKKYEKFWCIGCDTWLSGGKISVSTHLRNHHEHQECQIIMITNSGMLKVGKEDFLTEKNKKVKTELNDSSSSMNTSGFNCSLNGSM